MNVGIFGGSFNPVHKGHIALAQYLLEHSSLDEIWLTLSPLNPLKARPDELIADAERLEMLQLACQDHPGLKACDIELTLPRPSYTINTLNALCAQYPENQFRIVIGTDNWQIFDKWRSAQEIIDRFGVVVYPRPGYELNKAESGNVEFLTDAPTFDISSTQIRQMAAQGASPAEYLDTKVWAYIKSHELYGYKNN